MHSIYRNAGGKPVPVVEPKRWSASTVKRSRERSDHIASARMERKKRLATTQLLRELDRRAHRRVGGSRHPVGGCPKLARSRPSG
jgi:hypothetical protein